MPKKIDAAALVIDKDVPLPPRSNSIKTYTDRFAEMEIGDSIFFPTDRSKFGFSSATAALRKKGWSFATRNEAGGFRIWRMK
jgi:hypothetical protein